MADPKPPGFDAFAESESLSADPSRALAKESTPAESDKPAGFDEFVADDIREEKYGGVGQQVKAGLEGAASAATFGGSTAAEEYLGLAKAEDIRGRAEENPISRAVGQVGGLAATALLPVGGAAALLGKAGTTAAKATGLAGRAGFAARVGESAVKGAAESALFQGGEEISKAWVADPQHVGEHAAVDIGLATVLGGVFGGAAGAALQGIKKVAPGSFVSQADMPKYEAGDLKTLISADDALTPGKKSGLLDAFNITKQKPEAKEILAAQKVLGAPDTPAMLLGHDGIQMYVDAMANRPFSAAGSRVKDQLDQAYNVADSALTEASASRNALSKDQLGVSLRDSLTEQTRAAYAPQKEAFAELAAQHTMVPVDKEAIEGLAAALKEIKEVKIGGATEEARLVRQVLKTAENVKTADDINTLRNMSLLKDSGGAGVQDPLGWLKGKVRDSLVDIQEEAIHKFSRSFPRNDEAGTYMASLVDRAAEAKAAYRPYIKKLNTLSEWLGKGKIHGTEDALKFMNEKLTASDVAQRVFSGSKDPEFIRFFSKEFPKQFKMVRDYQRMALRGDSEISGVFSPKKFFKKFNDLEPEVQKSLYAAKEIKKIQAADTFMSKAFPKNFNPSGTSHMMALREAVDSPTGLIRANIADAAMERAIKGLESLSNPEVQNARSLGKASVAGWNATSKAIKGLFDAGTEAAGRVSPAIPTAILNQREERDRDKLKKSIESYTKEPEKLFDIGANNPLPQYSAAFALTASRAVQYLATLRPNTAKKSPLDAPVVPSKAEESAYNRQLDIAQRPLSVVTHIKDGTVTPQDVVTVRTIYPSLYKRLSEEMHQSIVDQTAKGKIIPYKTRLGMSLFLAEPLDSTMTQQGILSAQPKPSPDAQNAPQQGAPAKSSSKALSKLPGSYRTPQQARQEKLQTK